MKLTLWDTEIRDPYCGGWVPVRIRVLTDDKGEVIKVQVENQEKHLVDAKPATDV